MSEYRYQVEIRRRDIVVVSVGFLINDFELIEEVQDWLKANTKSSSFIDEFGYKPTMYFEDEADALLFKLTWGGE